MFFHLVGLFIQSKQKI